MHGKIHKLANLAADIVLDIILADSLNDKLFTPAVWVTLKRNIAEEGGYTLEGSIMSW